MAWSVARCDPEGEPGREVGVPLAGRPVSGWAARPLLGVWHGERVAVNFGTGPGEITADGCAVEVYARLPADGVPEFVHGQVADGASVLDLGAGVGRIADPLRNLGHRVVAVDDSRAMLDRVRSAATVQCSIDDLRLADRFDVALLVSYLVNTPKDFQRRSFLSTARHHLVPSGAVIMQWHPPEWFDSLDTGGQYPGGAGHAPGRPHADDEGRSASTLEVESITNGVLTAVVTYDLDAQRWTHGWQARRLTVQDLYADLQAAGLRFDRFGQRRQELVQQVAVRGVQLDQVEARPDRAFGRRSEGVHDAAQLVSGQRPGLGVAVEGHRRRCHGGPAALPRRAPSRGHATARTWRPCAPRVRAACRPPRPASRRRPPPAPSARRARRTRCLRRRAISDRRR